ncbi:MAG: hypothetical protein A3I66_16245 [Burkholderiales bacterium RIFCSPLOWO2_02_FULL_57_36]|nr:MAG: hypothetical protein A3I66_16245 [Burkholderiales bacterium RIFCSPLOWO2_02_FULL_57_36]
MLSMPCESEAGALIALGALRSDLERATANHVGTHFDLLLRMCRERMAVLRRGGESAGFSSWDVRNVVEETCWRFAADNDSSDLIVLEDSAHRLQIKRGGKLIPNPNGPCRRYITRENALGWQLHNLPLPQITAGGSALGQAVYSALPGCCGPILEENLRRSYDGLVLIGQGAARDTTYMQKLYAVGFVSDEQRFPLGELLTLHHSEKKYIRRLRFLNERVQEDSGYEAWLVVADGIPALLAAERLFPTSDIIGVCNRDAAIDTIDQLRDRLSGIVRYYSDMNIDSCMSGSLPTGVLLRVLQRKT